MSDIFISYASRDQQRVEPLANWLENKGWSVCWNPPVPAGERVTLVIKKALDAARAVIVVWSSVSVDSVRIVREATEGLRRNILFPVMLEEVNVPPEFSGLSATQLLDWDGSLQHPGLALLFESLSNALGVPAFSTTDTLLEPEPEKSIQKTPVAEIQTPEGMVVIPKGQFLYGDNKEPLTIDYDYWIDICPVTNQQYRQFIRDGGYNHQASWSQEGWLWKTEEKIAQPYFWDDAEWNQPEHPVVGVSYFEAEAFANWAGKRLPTEQEWEKAARGTDGRKYPWGQDFDKAKCNSGIFAMGSTTPVRKYANGTSPFGCYDMAGNVWEWCASWYDNNRNGRVLRGGSWFFDAYRLRSAYRDWLYPWYLYHSFGFRCAKDVK